MAAKATRFNAVETRFHGRYAGKMLDTLFQAYRTFFGRTLLMLALGFLGRLFLLGNANLIGYWVDSACRPPAQCRPVPGFLQGFGSQDFLLLLCAMTALGFLLTVVFRVGISRLSVEAVSSIYDETTYRTSRLPMSFFDQNPAGRIMTRFSSDYNGLFRIFGGPIAEFLSLIFDLLAMTVLLAVAGPYLLPFWLLLAGLNFAVYRLQLPSLRRERRESALRRSPGIAHFAETASGASTIRAFGKQATFSQRFTLLNDAYLDQRLRATTAFSRFSLSMGLTTALVFLITGLASIQLVREGRVSIGSVGVAFTYLGLASSILQSFFDWLGQFEEALTGLERMNEYLRLPMEPGALLPATARFRTGHPKEDGDSAATTRHVRLWDGKAQPGASIEVRDLWMRYRADLPLVLQGVNLDVRAGERLAVVGKTGSGKTSLVQALFRLYPIERGTIRVDGRDAESGLAPYRALMSYITQEPTLFLGTIRANLRADSPPGEAADDELIGALRRVQFLRVDATDEEYRYWLDYPVEERGRNLSAGERQLICMARCLLQDSPVVILDEATSAVDPRSEEILTRATEEVFAGKTQILIAHRLSTVRSCDRVLWLQNGKVHRLGRPTEVLREFESADLEA